MAAGEVRVPLSTPIKGHAGPISEVVLRAPKAADFFELGEPQVVAYGKEGLGYVAENTETVRAYIERLVIEPDAMLLAQLSLADAMKVKSAVLGFFIDARQKP